MAADDGSVVVAIRGNGEGAIGFRVSDSLLADEGLLAGLQRLEEDHDVRDGLAFAEDFASGFYGRKVTVATSAPGKSKHRGAKAQWHREGRRQGLVHFNNRRSSGLRRCREGCNRSRWRCSG